MWNAPIKTLQGEDTKLEDFRGKALPPRCLARGTIRRLVGRLSWMFLGVNGVAHCLFFYGMFSHLFAIRDLTAQG